MLFSFSVLLDVMKGLFFLNNHLNRHRKGTWQNPILLLDTNTQKTWNKRNLPFLVDGTSIKNTQLTLYLMVKDRFFFPLRWGTRMSALSIVLEIPTWATIQEKKMKGIQERRTKMFSIRRCHVFYIKNPKEKKILKNTHKKI